MKDNTLEFKKKTPMDKPMTMRRVEYMVIATSVQTFDDDDVIIDDIREGSKLTREQLLALPQGPAFMVGQTVNYAVNMVAQKTMEVLHRIFSVAELKLPPMPQQGEGLGRPDQVDPVTGHPAGTDTVMKNGPLN